MQASTVYIIVYIIYYRLIKKLLFLEFLFFSNVLENDPLGPLLRYDKDIIKPTDVQSLSRALIPVKCAEISKTETPLLQLNVKPASMKS